MYFKLWAWQTLLNDNHFRMHVFRTATLFVCYSYQSCVEFVRSRFGSCARICTAPAPFEQTHSSVRYLPIASVGWALLRFRRSLISAIIWISRSSVSSSYASWSPAPVRRFLLLTRCHMHGFSPWPLLGCHGRVGRDHTQNPEAANCFERPSPPQLAASSRSGTAHQQHDVRTLLPYRYISHGPSFAPNISTESNQPELAKNVATRF
jgi:hypothetical protein